MSSSFLFLLTIVMVVFMCRASSMDDGYPGWESPWVSSEDEEFEGLFCGDIVRLPIHSKYKNNIPAPSESLLDEVFQEGLCKNCEEELK